LDRVDAIVERRLSEKKAELDARELALRERAAELGVPSDSLLR
jgi:hypothetical protein